jgi:hypothetical protein
MNYSLHNVNNVFMYMSRPFLDVFSHRRPQWENHRRAVLSLNGRYRKLFAELCEGIIFHTLTFVENNVSQLSLKKSTILLQVLQNGIPLHYESMALRNSGPHIGDLNLRLYQGADVLNMNKKTEGAITLCYRHDSNPTLRRIPLVHTRCWDLFSLKCCC